FGLLPQGTELDFSQGTHKIVAIDLSNGDKDTLTVIVECLQLPPSFIYRDTVPADGLPYVLCLDSTELLGTVVSVSNACEDASGEYVSFFIDTANFCVKYEPIKCGGTEQACIVVCDDLGVCDTTYMIITVDYSLCTAVSHKIMDTLLVNFTGSFCIDTSSLPFPVESVENLCPGDSGESVDFDYDPATHCVTWTTFMQGQDQACFLLTDTMGNTDTVYFCVIVTVPESGIILDTILLGQSETYCFDISELAGNVLSIENYCPASSGDQVVFTLDAVGLCLQAQGIALGTDTACIVICDSYGTCDTTLVLVTVVPDTGDPCFNSLPPTAVDDTATTALNTPVNIDILANDTLGICLPVMLTVLSPATGGIGPHFGLTALNADQTVDYLPFADFCGKDSFQYVLCSPVGCDTATVRLDVACAKLDSIIIYNGFSPNGDETNEVFKIENIERFGDNEVIVYNRWGNLVFQEIGYANTWDGTYQNTGLPDGTYFYIIRLNDLAKREYSGYLQIHR
ncbi:MAG: gliding motility-associated C-terminal domain-containing protein, partial [Bacteroidota bacterium]